MARIEKIIVASLSLAYLIWICISAFSDPRFIHFADDIGVSFGVAHATLNGDIPLAGQPSHFGGRHLGPFYYWALAGIYQLAAKDIFLTIVLLGCLKALTIVALILFGAVVSKAQSKCAVFVICLLGFVCSSGLLVLVQTPWINHFLIIPVALMLVTLWMLLRWGWQWCPLYLLCASLAVQSFLGCAVYAGVISLGAIILVVARRDAYERQSLARFLVWTFAFVIIWLPSLTYELFYDSNIGKILGRHSTKGFEFDLTESLSALMLFLGRHSLGAMWDILTNVHALLTLVIALLAFGALIMFAVRVKGAQAMFVSLLLLGITATTLAIACVEGAPLGFYYNMLIPSVLILGTCIIAQIFYWFEKASIGVVGKSSLGACALVVFMVNSNELSTHLHWNYMQRSLAHANYLGELFHIQNKDREDVKIVLRGKHYKRRSAVWAFYNPEAAYQMAYAPFFKELSSFRRTAVGKKTRKQQAHEAQLAFLEHCGPKAAQAHFRLPERLSTFWVIDEKIRHECSTCEACALYRLVRRATDE